METVLSSPPCTIPLSKPLRHGLQRPSAATVSGWLQERHDWPDLSAIGYAACTRWEIEHSLHWVLDVYMDDDQVRNRKGNSGRLSGVRSALDICLGGRRQHMVGSASLLGWSQPCAC